MATRICRVRYQQVFAPLLGAILALHLPASPEAQIDATGVIAGSVVDASARITVVEATVALVPRAPQLPGLPSIRKVLTNTRGEFRFEQLPQGEYSIQVTKPGYLPATYREDVDVATEDSSIVISSVRLRHDIVVALSKLAVISGDVHDERGLPMARVTLAALSRQSFGGREHFVVSRRAQADQHGAYRIADLMPGQYVIAVETASASKDGASFPTTFFPGTLALSDATRLDLAAGVDRRDIDVIVASRGTFKVAGAISGGDRLTPLATVHLVSARSDGPTSDTAVLTVAASPQGRFAFSNVPPGEYVIRITDAPWHSRAAKLVGRGLNVRSLGTDRLPVFPPAGEGEIWYAETPVRVESKDVTSLQVTLEHGLRLSGHVKFEGQKVPTLAVPELHMFVYPIGGAGSSYVAPLEFGTDLTILTPQLRPGRYAIGFLRGASGWTLRSIDINGRNVAGFAFDLTADVSDLTVTLADENTSLSGSVTRDQRNPGATEESYVLVFPSDPALWDVVGFLPPFRLHSVKTINGRFSIPVIPGEYALVATQSRPRTDWALSHNLKDLLPVATLVKASSGEMVVAKSLRVRRLP